MACLLWFVKPNYQNTSKKVIYYILLLFSGRAMRSCSLSSVGIRCVFETGRIHFTSSSAHHEAVEFVETIAGIIRSCCLDDCKLGNKQS